MKADAAPIPVPEHAPLRELTLGRRAAPPIPTPHLYPLGVPDDEDEPGQTEARCRSKAEAARRVAEPLRGIREGADDTAEDHPIDPDLDEWADRLTDGFHWQSAPGEGQSTDVSPLDDAAGCFEALAEALGLAAAGEGRRGAGERALPLLAEAQSMLRRALQRLQVHDDPDQLAAFEWLKTTAARHHVYIPRFMRAEDQADPAGWRDLLARVRRRRRRKGTDRPASTAPRRPARRRRPTSRPPR